AEAGEHAERSQAIERGREGRLADAVVGDGALGPLGDFGDTGWEVLRRIVDDVVGAAALGDLRFGRRADGSDDGGAEMLAPLAENLADAAGRGVDEDEVAGLYAIGLAQQVLGGEALQHHRRRLLIADIVRQLDEVLD